MHATTRPTPADYDGISHARLTRRMTQARLPATAKAVMMELFRALPVGVWRQISHATLARRCGVGEATVSRAMALLAGEALDADGRLLNPTPFLARRRVTARGGYEVCLLPPPELRPRAPDPARVAASDETPVLADQLPLPGLFDPSTVDPHGWMGPQGVRTAQTPIHDPSTVDGCLFLDHACSSGSMRGTESEPVSAAQPEPTRSDRTPTDLPPAEALAQLGLLAHQWRALAEVAPAGYGMRDAARDLAALRSRDDVRNPFGLLRKSLAHREPILDRDELVRRQAELAALTTAPEVPTNDSRSANASSGRPARPGPRRPDPARISPPTPSITRDEWLATPFVDAASLGLPLPVSRRNAAGQPGGGDGGAVDLRGPLRE